MSWPVVIEARSEVFHLETIDISTRGAKVRPARPLDVGTLAQLHFHPPGDGPLDLAAFVWRVDLDGLAFFFIEDIPVDLAKYSVSPGVGEAND